MSWNLLKSKFFLKTNWSIQAHENPKSSYLIIPIPALQDFISCKSNGALFWCTQHLRKCRMRRGRNRPHWGALWVAIVNRLTKAYRSTPPLQSNPSLSPSKDSIHENVPHEEDTRPYCAAPTERCRENNVSYKCIQYILTWHVSLMTHLCLKVMALSINKTDSKIQTVLSDKLVFERLALKPAHGQLSDIS